ncbi:MAG: hypothetical protein ABEI86_12695 [Halobacteriaceae archaeon]
MDLQSDYTGSELLGLVSAVVTVIAAFLPWITAGVEAGPVNIQTSNTGIEGLGIITLVLAVIAIGSILVLRWENRGAIITGISGLVVAIISLWKFVDISGVVSPGIGLYLTLISGIGILVAGGWGYQAGSNQDSAEAL